MTAIPASGMPPLPGADAAVAAARAVLESQGPDAGPDLLLVELSAWLLGGAGQPVPARQDPTEALHARLAAAAGSNDIAAVEALLDGYLPQEAGAMLLSSACELVGPYFPDRLIDVARRHPGRPFIARMLANTSDPARLLGLLPVGGAAGSGTIEAVGELVVTGRDRGRPVEVAEARWAQIAAEAPTHLAAFRDLLLRITVRESVEAAVSLLEDLGEEWGRDHILDGARAVISRLVRVDPDRAARLVGRSTFQWDRVAWLEGLAWWLELIPQAVPLVAELLDHGDPALDLAVARILTRTPELTLLDRSLHSVGQHDPVQVASSLAPGVYQLRAGGRLDVAERVRLRCLDALPTRPSRQGQSVATAGGQVLHAADVFEVIAGPGPALIPWACAVSGP